jgi:hypothetical protein
VHLLNPRRREHSPVLSLRQNGVRTLAWEVLARVPARCCGLSLDGWPNLLGWTRGTKTIENYDFSIQRVVSQDNSEYRLNIRAQCTSQSALVMGRIQPTGLAHRRVVLPRN